MPTFADIIDLWPKPAPVTLAGDLDELPGTVRQWRNRSVLPDRKWKATVEAAQRRGIEGVTLEILAEIAAQDAGAAGASAAAAAVPAESDSSFSDVPEISAAAPARPVAASLAAVEANGDRIDADALPAASMKHGGGPARPLPDQEAGRGPAPTARPLPRGLGR